MQSSFQRMRVGTIVLTITLAIAILGYMAFGWTPLEAIYMVIITIFGVGYGEVKPLETPAERLFTIFVIIAGTSSAVYIVGGFVQMLTEGEINRAFDVTRKQREMDSLQNHIIICGFGRVGQVLARQLTEVGERFIILDSYPENVAIAQSHNYLVYDGNPSDEDALAAVGIHRAKVLATVVPNDADNVFITLTARELNPNLLILARGELASTEKKLRLAGANQVVSPATVSGLRMANLIVRPSGSDLLGQAEELTYLNELLSPIDIQMEELKVLDNSLMIGRTIRELEVRAKGTFIVIGLRRPHDSTLIQPTPSLMLDRGYTIVILGRTTEIPKFASHYVLQQLPVTSY
ncbi:MAG: potassium channel protein [Jaaginema sp. PMC 1079.18]|nr:potassium channel protein [Jaaginema sp. PMC 1080.18]MEC4852460.1 potassium channel protein [Jaaginema sp. PMC 1079.18]MEC4867289.1 potassium channel protein [Jaaginema sp. PMC 1078.18]